MTHKSLLQVVALAAGLFCLTPGANAADHLDAPLLVGQGESDINDLYAFQSPNNPDNTVLIVTVNPFAGQVSGTTFGSDVSYNLAIDNDGDTVADVTYTTTFGAPVAGVQTLTTLRNGTAYAAGSTELDLPTSSGGTLRAGVFDDPFFFDLNGFQNGLMFTGEDAFAGANVSAIVIELPSSEINGADSNVAVWASTVVGGNQVDRMGRPAINTVLIPGGPMGRKDEFNQADPVNDLADFGADVEATIAALSDSANAAALTPILLPDVLTFNTADSSGFLNGRQLADDVIDAELTLLTGSSTPVGDGVDANDVSFRSSFPYLAPANVIVPEPATLALMAYGLSMLGLSRRRPLS